MFDSYTKLLLHFENNVNDIATGKIVTNNNVTFDNTDPKFNSYGIFNGTTSYLSIPASDDFYFGTDNFTIDFWIKFSDLTTWSFGDIIHQYNESDTDYWHIGFEGIEPGLSKLTLTFAYASVGSIYISYFKNFSFIVNTWYHICFERIGTTAKLFINGISQTLTESAAFGTQDVGNVDGNLATGDNIHSNYFKGNLDELRISKGIVRWTENFTPPTKPYGRSSLPTFYRS